MSLIQKQKAKINLNKRNITKSGLISIFNKDESSY